jgi:hypothetical protein
MTCNLIYHHKDMTSAGDLPVATLSVSVAILVRAPISGVPIAISVDNSSAVCMYSSPIGPTGMISAIGTTNGRTTFGVHRRAIIGLNCSASPIMGYFAVFPLISNRRKDWWLRRRERLVNISCFILLEGGPVGYCTLVT